MIRIYPSALPGEPIEQHEVTRRQTVHQWMLANVSGYEQADWQPVSISVDGLYIPASKWADEWINQHSVVEIYPVPRDGGALSILNPVGYFSTQATVSATSALISALIKYDLPSSNQTAGKSLAAGEVEANAARPLDPLRHIFGTYKVYPDLLSPVISRFEDKRKLISTYQLAVAAGPLTINSTDIRIGETPISAFGTDADFDIYAPGADISADSRFDIWYVAPEVGGTSAGSGGLDLGSTAPSGSAVIADSIYVDTTSVTLNGDDAEFPPAWSTGTIVAIKAPIDAVIASSGGYNTFTGDFQDVEPFVGMIVTVSTPANDYPLVVASWTDNGGTNDVLTFDDDDAVAFDEIVAGTYRVSISYRNRQYQITSISGLTANIDRLTDTGVVDSGWGGFTARTVSDYDFTSDTAGDVNWLGPFVAVPYGRTTDTIEYDVFFPSGLIQYSKDGDKQSCIRSTELQWRDADIGGAWTTVTNSFTEVTVNAIGFTYQLTLPYAMRPQVRMRRVESEGAIRTTDKINWYRLRSLMPERPASYDDVTTIALTIRGGDRLGAQTDRKISVIATGQPQTISDAVYYITDDLGIDRSLIDEAAIDALEDDYWTPRSEDFNFAVSGSQSARDVINTVLGAGFSTIIPSNGLISAVREGVKDSSGIITPHEQASALQVSFVAPSADDFNGVDVEYVNTDTWDTETIECRTTGVTATKVETITADGMGLNAAYRKGMRALQKHLYQRLSFEVSTEMDARNYDFLQRIELIDDMPETTQSALVLGYSVSGGLATLQCSESFSSVTNARVFLRRHDGTVTGLLTPSSVSGSVIVLNDSDIDFDIITDGTIEPARIVLCSTVEQGYSGIITAIEPAQDGTTAVRASEYNEIFYAYDDSEPE